VRISSSLRAAACWLLLAGLWQLQAQEPAKGPLLLAVQGKGDQVYRCAAGAWTLIRPDAVLFDDKGVQVGKHGAGPFWQYKDGSVVHGELVSKKAAPDAADVPWLVLRASAHDGDGLLSQVVTIERVETHGGQPPAVGCDAAHAGAELRVPYTAKYSFYGKP
jgi:hypothetical protein